MREMSGNNAIMTTVLDIENAIHHLPRSERSYLASKIIESLEEGDTLIEEWKNELDRRVQKFDSGESKSVTSEDLHAAIKSRLSLK